MPLTNPSGREILTADRTYYVRSDGSNSNNGLANTAGGAFLTIQYAVDLIANTIDANLKKITIKLGNSATFALVALKDVVGVLPGGSSSQNIPVIQGDTVTPANTIISATSDNAVGAVNCHTAWLIEGVEVTTATSGYGVEADINSLIYVKNVNFGACATAHMAGLYGGKVEAIGNYQITGAAPTHIAVAWGGQFLTIGAVTATGSGVVNFSNAFLSCTGGRIISSGVTWSGMGSYTGIRYGISNGGVISTTGTLPGNAAGIVSIGVYNDVAQSVPAFSVNKNGTNQTGIVSATWTTVTWGTELYDVGAYFASNGWTPPAGKVTMNAGLEISNTSTAGSLNAISILKNGSIYKQGTWYSSAANVGSLLITVDDIANGTDVYTIQVYATTSSGTTTVSGGTATTYFTGHWISA